MSKQRVILFLCDEGHQPHSLIENLIRQQFEIQVAELNNCQFDIDDLEKFGLILLCAASDNARPTSIIDDLLNADPYRLIPIILLINRNTDQSYISHCIDKGVIDYFNHGEPPDISSNKVKNYLKLFSKEKALTVANQSMRIRNSELERKIDSSNLNYRSIFYDSPFVIAVINNELKFIEFNRNLVIGGISTKNLVGKHVREFPLRLSLRNNLNVEHLLNSFFVDKITPKPKRAVIQNGLTEEHFEVFFSPLNDEENNVFLQVIFKDITKHVMAEVKARKNRMISDGLFEQAAVAVILIDVHTWKVVKSNKKYDNSLKELIDDLFDGDISHLLLSDVLNLDIAENIDKLLSNELSKYSHDSCIKKSTTECIWIRITLSSLRLSDDAVTNLIGIIEDITDQKVAEQLLNQINEVVSAKTGAEYFRELTAFLCRQFGVKYAFVGKYLNDSDSIETISFRSENVEFDNITYSLKGTPCNEVINGNICIYPKSVQEQFPSDKYLIDLKIESYFGARLVDENGQPIGIMSIMDTKAMGILEEKKRVMNMLLTRVTNEIKQRSYLKKIREEEAFSKAILNSMDSNIVVIDKRGFIIATNKAWHEFAVKNQVNSLNKISIGSNYFSVCEKAIEMGDDFASQALEGIRSVIEHRKTQFLMEYPCHSENQKAWFVMSVTSFEIDSKYTVIRHTNITQRKENEIKILDSITQLRLIEQINQLSLNNASQKQICSYVLSAYDSFLKIIGGRFYIYNEEQNALNLIAEERSDDKFYQLEKLLGFGLTGVLPRVSKDSFFYKVIHDKEIIHLSDPEEIVQVIKEHVDNPLLKKFAGWSKGFLDIRSFVMIPLVFNEKLFALITFSSKNAINEKELSKIKSFNTQIISALVKSKTETEKSKLVSDLTERYNDLTQYNYIVSHNLRAPIAQILGLCQVLDVKGSTMSDKMKSIDFIKNAALNLDELVRDLNDILAAKTTNNERRELVDLDEIFISVFKTFEKLIKDSKIIIELQIDENARNIFTIKTYLKSVIYNLVSNAIKHQSPNRRLTIHVSAKKIMDHLQIAISDNGIGINMKEHGHLLFGLYKRINLETEGKGLGLHMTKLQVEAMNGTIHVESELLKGSTFILKIPCDFQ